MTSDDQITADLAVVARASRARPITLASTLRAVGAAPALRRAPLVATLVATSTVFASRVARIVTSVYVLVLIAATYVPLVALPIHRDAYDEGSPIARLFSGNVWSFALAIGFSGVIVHLMAWAWAARRFERMIGAAPDPLGRGQQLARGVERWSTTLTIAAIVSFVMVFGLLRIAIGDHELNELRPPGVGFEDVMVVARPSWWRAHRAWTVVGLGVALFTSIGGAIFIARRQWSINAGVAGAIALAITILVGLRYDAGPVRLIFSTELLPSYALRTVLAIAGLCSLLAITAGFVSARGRRERAAIDGE